MDDIRNFLDDLVRSGKVPGCECIVYQDHKQIFRHRAGWADYKHQRPVAEDDLYHC